MQLVTCVQILHGQEVLQEEHLCPVAEKPLTSVPCVIRTCSYEWSFSEWSEVPAPLQMQQFSSSSLPWRLQGRNTIPALSVGFPQKC